jgi:hypothetical protein
MKMEIGSLSANNTLKESPGMLGHVQWLRRFEWLYCVHIQSEVVFVTIYQSTLRNITKDRTVSNNHVQKSRFFFRTSVSQHTKSHPRRRRLHCIDLCKSHSAYENKSVMFDLNNSENTEQARLKRILKLLKIQNCLTNGSGFVSQF